MPLENPLPRQSVFQSVAFGVCCCAIAAVGYTAANACLNQSMIDKIDPVWVTCLKESTAFLYAAICVLIRFFRRLPVFPPWKELGILLAVGLSVQYLGNLGYLWAMGKVGLSVTVPANYGMQLFATALFGWLILGERVSFRSAMALGLLIIAIVLLKLGAKAVNSDSSSATIMLAVAASCLAGLVFAGLSIALRRCSKVAVEQSVLLFIVAGSGAITMWPLSFYRMGAEGVFNTPSNALAWMLGASFFNLIGFLGIAKGLQLISVVHASVLNASQVAMSAVVGMVFFRESHNFWVVLGIIVTVAGIMLVDRPKTAAETVEVAV
jgi:drug/metabolite transporter, DME family